MARQSPNVSRMRLLGAEVVGVDAGSKTLKDAINEAMRDWSENVATTHYVLGSALGPHPYPTMVREFQSVIGREARPQFRRLAGRDPRAVVACVGGGSNAIGLFSAYLATRVALYGVEAGGRGAGPGEHAARFAGGAAGVLHGTRTMLLQDGDGQVLPTHSVSAGLDYPAVGPGARRPPRPRPGRVREGVRRRGARRLRAASARLEGILPALESVARGRLRVQAGAEVAAVVVDPRQSLGPRRQGPRRVPARPGRRARSDAASREAFARARGEGRAAFVAYLTAGDPSADATVGMAKALARAGADVLELGVPFSDPIADGPVLQRAASRALAAGTTLDERLRDRAADPRADADGAGPLLVPEPASCAAARPARRRRPASAGFDGALLTDLPPEEAAWTRPHFRAAGLDTIFLVSPTSPPPRMAAAAKLSSGFLYVVSRSGTTGARATLPRDLRSHGAPRAEGGRSASGRDRVRHRDARGGVARRVAGRRSRRRVRPRARGRRGGAAPRGGGGVPGAGARPCLPAPSPIDNTGDAHRGRLPEAPAPGEPSARDAPGDPVRSGRPEVPRRPTWRSRRIRARPRTDALALVRDPLLAGPGLPLGRRARSSGDPPGGGPGPAAAAARHGGRRKSGPRPQRGPGDAPQVLRSIPIRASWSPCSRTASRSRPTCPGGDSAECHRRNTVPDRRASALGSAVRPCAAPFCATLPCPGPLALCPF